MMNDNGSPNGGPLSFMPCVDGSWLALFA